MRAKHPITAALALAALWAFTAPAAAHIGPFPSYDTKPEQSRTERAYHIESHVTDPYVPEWEIRQYPLESLFSTSMLEYESFRRLIPLEETLRDPKYDVGKSYFETLDHVTRYPEPDQTTLRLTEKTVLASFVEVVIPEGHTLVVEQGTTLYLFGRLTVEGTLENNGLIVVGNKKLAEVAGDTLSELRCTGAVDNRNTIRVYRGTVVNTGTFTNRGTFLSVNKAGLDGIVNQAGGTLRNTGTIRLENTDAFGLRCEQGGTVDNTGAITRLSSAGISGSVQGNAPTLMNQ